MAFVGHFVQPFPLIVLGLGWLLVVHWWRWPERRVRLRWLVFFYVLLLLDTSPLVSRWTTHWWEGAYPPSYKRPSELRAIVVLGGDFHPPEHPDEPTRMGVFSWVRAERAAELYRQGPAIPIVVCGGNPHPEVEAVGAAIPMAAYLEAMGVSKSDLVIDDQSRNTVENAANSIRLLKARGITEGVAVVSHAFHLRRAERIFRKQGLTPIPIGCGYRSWDFRYDWGILAPRPAAAHHHQEIAHELLSMGLWWWRGKL